MQDIAFCAATKIHTGLGLSYVHTQERLWRRDFCDETKLRPPKSKVERDIADRFCAILWCSVNIYSPRRGSKIRSLSSDDGDSNENLKKAIGLHGKKKTTLHVHHSCCTFLWRHCTTTTWKCVIFRFMEFVNKRRRTFLSLSKLERGPQEINSRELRLHLTFSATWN